MESEKSAPAEAPVTAPQPDVHAELCTTAQPKNQAAEVLKAYAVARKERNLDPDIKTPPKPFEILAVLPPHDMLEPEAPGWLKGTAVAVTNCSASMDAHDVARFKTMTERIPGLSMCLLEPRFMSLLMAPNVPKIMNSRAALAVCVQMFKGMLDMSVQDEEEKERFKKLFGYRIPGTTKDTANKLGKKIKSRMDKATGKFVGTVGAIISAYEDKLIPIADVLPALQQANMIHEASMLGTMYNGIAKFIPTIAPVEFVKKEAMEERSKHLVLSYDVVAAAKVANSERDMLSVMALMHGRTTEMILSQAPHTDNFWDLDSLYKLTHFPADLPDSECVPNHKEILTYMWLLVRKPAEADIARVVSEPLVADSERPALIHVDLQPDEYNEGARMYHMISARRAELDEFSHMHPAETKKHE